MKVCFLIDNPGSGGAQRQITNVACLMKKQGTDVSFVVYGDADFFLPTLQKENIDVCKVEAESYFDRVRIVRTTLRRSGADVVISFMSVPNMIACMAAIGRKKWKLIISERSCTPRVFGGIKGLVYRIVSVFADCVVCNSKKAAQMWKQFCPHMKSKIEVIYNAVNDAAVYTQPQIKEDEPYRMTVAASFQTVKNPISVVQAVQMLDENNKRKLQLHWFGRFISANGDDSIYRQTAQYIEQNRLQDTVMLHPESTDIFTEMAKSDCVGLFSLYEGLPNVICEAMTVGRPVMMTPVSDHDVLIGAQNGFLCTDTDARSIAEALTAFLQTDRDTLLQMGKMSATKANDLFASDVVLAQWMQVCRKENAK